MSNQVPVYARVESYRSKRKAAFMTSFYLLLAQYTIIRRSSPCVFLIAGLLLLFPPSSTVQILGITIETPPPARLVALLRRRIHLVRNSLPDGLVIV